METGDRSGEIKESTGPKAVALRMSLSGHNARRELWLLCYLLSEHLQEGLILERQKGEIWESKRVSPGHHGPW